MDKVYFPYGNKSKEFLIKRSLYLCFLLNKYNIDYIVLACNTLSLSVLDFLRQYYKVAGVFESLRPKINSNSCIIGSLTTINILKDKVNNSILLLDGSSLIYAIENNLDYKKIIEEINKKIKARSNIVLACTHFLALESNLFCIEEVKNK